MRYFLYLCNYVYNHLVLKKIIFLVLFLSVFVGKSFSSEIVFQSEKNDNGGKSSSVVVDAKKKDSFDYSVELFSGAKLDFDGITAGARVKLPFYDIKTYFKNEDDIIESLYDDAAYETIKDNLYTYKIAKQTS